MAKNAVVRCRHIALRFFLTCLAALVELCAVQHADGAIASRVLEGSEFWIWQACQSHPQSRSQAPSCSDKETVPGDPKQRNAFQMDAPSKRVKSKCTNDTGGDIRMQHLQHKVEAWAQKTVQHLLVLLHPAARRRRAGPVLKCGL